MIERKIVIKGCGVCPYVDHRGAFGQVSRIPCCTRKNKNLPYREVANGRGGLYAEGTGEIPDWCPLRENTPTLLKALKVVHDFYRNQYEFSTDHATDDKLNRFYEDVSRELRVHLKVAEDKAKAELAKGRG